ncbi:hypothetical protein Nepgr_024554 [Nepenthes gracilis]|uniref:ATP-dependent RNA helicase n=1 Tax=Nepenthes gracilis TaxID=150966 RepID=A0AAD3Y0L8_NEPGR|nr:hypothetical protein Nepgr_024554 [Nepenthes gracilis]
MPASTILRQRSKFSPQHLLSFIISVRWMGGGPRSFTGGLNKWQWKRLHEKKAREKEKKLLEQEKLLYQARLRSQIRSKLAASGGKSLPDNSFSDQNPKDHIKALADRFLKAGAEDLWNENHDPIRIFPTQNLVQMKPIDPPIDLRKLVTDGRNIADAKKVLNSINLMNFYGSWQQKRDYSADIHNTKSKTRFNYRRNGSSSSDDDGYGIVSRNVSNARWPKFSFEGDEREEEEREGSGGRNVRSFMSGAALEKYHVKTTKRRVLKLLEDDCDEEGKVLSESIERIRQEVNDRKLSENELEKNEELLLSEKRFEDCDISPLTVKALTSAGYVQMTRVQEACLSVCLEGKDAIVKSKAGTGKSAAFLVPAIEAVLQAISGDRVQHVPPVYVLILCPMRELASQIAAETRVLLKYHDGLGIQALVGGTRFKDDHKRLESDPCQILVATPGRLLDHIESRSGLSVRLMGLKMLIVDEADHLLDLGFRKDLERIADCLSRERQSLLFSATIPREVRRISQLVLKKDHAFIDMVGAGCPEIHYKVKQSCVVAPHEQHFQIAHQLLKQHISQILNYKVIVFCTTGMVTSLVYLLFREMQLNVREIHSRKPQLYRSQISDEFRQSKNIILISSDVSARGMNYPDVTLVIQVGVPYDREQYIHRLGRTGREGKDGEGILLLAPWEEYFLEDLKGFTVGRSSLPHIDHEAKVKMEDSMAKIDTSVKEGAYHAWLGYYNSIKEIGRDKTTLVELANRFSSSIGLPKPPALFRKTAVKMGLRDIPGIRIRK